MQSDRDVTANPPKKVPVVTDGIRRIHRSGMDERDEPTDAPESGGESAGFDSFLAALAASPPPYRPPTLEPGAVFGDRYCVQRELGRGGMGTVYLAVDRQLGRKVALKIARGRRAETEIARLQSEATIMANLSHPGIVTVFEAGEADAEDVFLALEFVPGGTLRDWIDVESRPWRMVVAMFIPIAEALSAAHRAGVVHRDFKPHNVLLDLDGRPRIADFGLARLASDPQTLEAALLSSSGTLTVSGSVVGTPAYMAPEQAKGESATEASDQFSFFVSLFEALTLERPFGGATLQAILDSIENGPPSHVRNAPRELARIIRRGLAAEPGQRHRDMADVARALAKVLRARRRVLAGGAIAAGAFVAAGFGFASAPSAPEPCPRAELSASVDEVWTEDARERVRAAAGPDVADAMDAYRDALVDHRSSTCLAHAVEGSLSDTDVALRTACINRLEGRFAGLKDDLVEHAAPAESLDDLLTATETCDDVQALRRLYNAYDDTSVRKTGADAKASWDAARLRMKAALQSRRGEDASATVEDLLALAKQHGLIDMEAYALVIKSTDQTDIEQTASLLELAQVLANDSRNTQLLTEIALQRSSLAQRRGQEVAALAFLDTADAMVGFHGTPRGIAQTQVRIELARLSVRVTQGDTSTARRGAEALLRSLEPDSPEAFEARTILADSLADRGLQREALAEYARLLEHPLAKDPVQMLGLQLNRAMIAAGAAETTTATQALDAASAAFGGADALPPEFRAYIALGRAMVFRWTDELAEASRRAIKAQALLEEVDPNHAHIAGVLEVRSSIASAGGDEALALSLAEAAVEKHIAATGPESAEVGLARARLARALHANGRDVEAAEAAKIAIGALDELGRPDEEIAVAELALANATGTPNPTAREACARSQLALCREALASAAANALSP